MRTSEQEWSVTSFPLKLDEWSIADLSWSQKDGLMLYVNDTFQQSDNTGIKVSRVRDFIPSL